MSRLQRYERELKNEYYLSTSNPSVQMKIFGRKLQPIEEISQDEISPPLTPRTYVRFKRSRTRKEADEVALVEVGEDILCPPVEVSRKLIVIGASGSGKSSMIERFVSNTFDPHQKLTAGGKIKIYTNFSSCFYALLGFDLTSFNFKNSYISCDVIIFLFRTAPALVYNNTSTDARYTLDRF